MKYHHLSEFFIAVNRATKRYYKESHYSLPYEYVYYDIFNKIINNLCPKLTDKSKYEICFDVIDLILDDLNISSNDFCNIINCGHIYFRPFSNIYIDNNLNKKQIVDFASSTMTFSQFLTEPIFRLFSWTNDDSKYSFNYSSYAMINNRIRQKLLKLAKFN